MLIWENSKDLEREDYKRIRDEIEAEGSTKLADLANQGAVDGYRWVKDFKVWEYPFVVLWLEQLREKIGRKRLKVMDFGCGFSPLAQYLGTKGYDVVGADNTFIGYPRKVNRELLKEEYPDVRFYIGDVGEMEEGDFDAIISCSVLEHIMPRSLRFQVMEQLKDKRRVIHFKETIEGGSYGWSPMCHVIDYYFPEKPGRGGDRRINVYDLLFQIPIQDYNKDFCPGSSVFDFNMVRKKINFTREWNQEARIVIGTTL